MARMPAQLSGTSYSEMVDKYAAAAARKNGEVVTTSGGADEQTHARLTNIEVCALWTALKWAAQRGHYVIPESDWQLLWLALGWTQPGDRFVDTREHADAFYDESMLAEMWDAFFRFAGGIDADGTKVRPMSLSYAWPKAYYAAEHDAWEAMKRYNADVKLPLPGRDPIDVEPPKESPIPPPTLPRAPTLWPWLLVGLLLLLPKKKRRTKR